MQTTRVARSFEQGKDFELHVKNVAELEPGDIFTYGLTYASRTISWMNENYIDSSDWVTFVRRTDAAFGYDIEHTSVMGSDANVVSRFAAFETVVVLGDEVTDCVVNAAIGG